MIEIDQTPIGRTPRSNPATYTDLFTHVRELYSLTPEAKVRGYKPGRFSFNVRGGRCEACKGDGQIKIEMHFLPDVYVPCETCHGRRYNRRRSRFASRASRSPTCSRCRSRRRSSSSRRSRRSGRRLQTLHDVGLDYVRLGQPATTLSGGEAQRVKLAAELSKIATGRTLYILDEPTTGLHFADIEKLLEVLQRLVDTGNTVLVIEHNLDVIKQADWVVDLGPEGGEAGGELIAAGTPEDVADVDGLAHRAVPARGARRAGRRCGLSRAAPTARGLPSAGERSSAQACPGCGCRVRAAGGRGRRARARLVGSSPQGLDVPRQVFVALSETDDLDVGARAEPILAITILAGTAGVLLTPAWGRLMNDPSVDGLVAAIVTFIAGIFYGAAGYFLLGLALWLGAKAVGVDAPFRIARQLLGFAALPVALSLVVLVPAIVLGFGADWFRSGGDDEGTGATSSWRSGSRSSPGRSRSSRSGCGRRSACRGAASSARSASRV